MDDETQSNPSRRAIGLRNDAKPRKGPGRQAPDATKQRNLDLLDKSLDLFFHQGFERTTIDAVAASVGMAKRTVYLRYGSKTGLFKASLQRAIEEWILPVSRLRAAETDDLEETLLKIGRLLVANIMSPAGLRLMRITNAESGRMPEVGALSLSRGTQPTAVYLTDFIRRRIRPNGAEITDPEEAAMAFLYLVVGGPASMTAWGLTLSGAVIDKHTRYAVHLFLHGLLHSDSHPPTSARPARRREASQETAHSGRIGALEEENRRLKMLLADSMLEISSLRDGIR